MKLPIMGARYRTVGSPDPRSAARLSGSSHCRSRPGSRGSATRSRVERCPQPEGGGAMPLFMDVHHMDGGVAVGDVAAAHMADLQEQSQHGVNYLKYWVNEAEGRIFCLVDAPNAEAANTVHREAHGLVADEIYEVSEGT